MNNKEVITLLDEQGKEIDFTLLTVVEVGEHRYALLLPVVIEGDEDENEEAEHEMEVVVMRAEGENLLLVENDEELDQVLAYVEENNILDELQ